jgi:HlyD family secretion protein
MKAKLNFWILLLFSVSIIISCKSRNNLSDAYGNFEATQVNVSAENPGRIIYLHIDEGMQVDSGQIVALIDTTDLYLKKLQLLAQNKAIQVKNTQIESQVAVQQQQKNNLLFEKNRIVRLLSENAATQKQLDDINGNIELIDKQILQIKTQNSGVASETEVINTQINQIKASLSKCYIRNPVKGTVTNKYAESGEIASPGRALYKIADLSVMELKVYVSGDQLAQVKTGHKAEVIIDDQTGADRKLTGTVSWVSPKAEFTPKIIQTKEERVNLVYAVKIRVPNDGSLKIAMPAEVNF